MSEATLYLIPNTLGSDDVSGTIPLAHSQTISGIRHFIVESEKSAKSFLKKLSYPHRFDEIHFYTLNEHTPPADIPTFIEPLKKGESIGVISDAGCPGIADPGADVVRLAHLSGYSVKPLTGPSSILLALMGSGMNGQAFTFHGYLPYEKDKRQKQILDMERQARSSRHTHIFIEAPYRNRNLLTEILQLCKDDTLIGIGCDLTMPQELMKTKSVLKWKSSFPEINKKPCIFLIGS